MLQTDKFEKLFDKIVRQGQVNVGFSDACYFTEHLGFRGRQNGTSHRVYSMEGIPEIINLQEKNGMAKPYQIRQIAKIVKRYKLGGEENEEHE